MKKSKKQPKEVSKLRKVNDIELENGLPFSIGISEAIENKENLDIWQQETMNWLSDQHSILENMLSKYDPFDVIGNLIMLEISYNPETYKESEHEGLSAVVEYVALTYLKHPYPPIESQSETTTQEILEISARTKRILLSINNIYIVGSFSKQTEDNSNISFFRARTISNELYVRNPSYPHHYKEQLKKIFSSYENILMQHLGFSVIDLLQVENSMNNLWNTNLQNKRKEAIDIENELLRLREEAIKYTDNEDNTLPHIQYLKKLSLKKARIFIRNTSKTWFARSIGKTFAFSDITLSEASGLSTDTINAITRFFSVPFASEQEGFTMFSPTHKLKQWPFIKNNDYYMYVAPGTLTWAIQPRLEEYIQNLSKLNQNLKNVWTSYQKSRASYLESECLNVLNTALRNSKKYQSLSYSTKNGNNIMINTELDGIIIYDSTLILVEAKAGNFVSAAKRGAKESLKSVIKKLIGDAHYQVVRAKNFIESSEECEFTLPDKSKLFIRKQDFQRIIPIVVTLESLDAFNSVLHEVAKTGLLPAEELPWVVSLDILRVICEIIEFPTQLIHYLIRRLRLNDFKKFEAHDELDWFGLYLDHGLYYEDDEKVRESTVVSVLSHTDAFDAYYAYKTGTRKKAAPQPKQRMPHLFRQIILELDSKANRNYTESVLMLLDWSSSTRQEFTIHFDAIRKRTIKDGKSHNFAFAAKAGLGLTCASTFVANHLDALKHVSYLVTLRKYEQRSNKWLGLVTSVDSKYLIDGCIIDKQPWEFDEVLEKSTQKLSPPNLWPLKPLR